MRADHASELDRAKRQIRALLALGKDDGAAEAEADNALRFARRLMLRHNLSEAELGERVKDPHEIAAETEYGTADHWTEGEKMSLWEASLAWAIVKLVGTLKWYIKGGVHERRTDHGTLLFDDAGETKKGRRVIFYGPSEDAIEASALVDEWATTIAAMARMRFGGALRGPGRSYCEGFASALLAKAEAIQREERAEIQAHQAGLLAAPPSSTALELIRSTDVMAAKLERCTPYLQSTGVHLRGGARFGGGKHYLDAYSAGASDGERASFARRERHKRLGPGA